MNQDNQNQLVKVVERLVGTILDDYTKSGKSGLVGDRQEVYRTFYRVRDIPLAQQERPVVFVDSGYHAFESDVVSLMVVSAGACVRDEDGRLHYLSEIGDFITPEFFALYSSWSEEEGDVRFKIKLIPFEEGSFLLRDDLAYTLSERLTELFNAGLKRDVERERLIKLHKRTLKYLVSLIELAYAIKVGDLLSNRSLGVIDGTLARWFGVKYVGFFAFDGIDILSILLNKTREVIVERLMDTYGLVKTTKFTSIARARWVFKNQEIGSSKGLYADSTQEKVEKTAAMVNSVIKPKYGDKVAEDTVYLFNRVTYKWSDIWAVRVPVTTDGSIIMHFEAYSRKPVISYSKITGASPNPDVAEEVFLRINQSLPQVMAYRTGTYGLPPYGFMEIDQHVRIPTKRLSKLLDLFVNAIRSRTGEIGHPLEYLFEPTRRMRLGY